MPPSRGDAAGAPRGDLEIAAAPAPVAPAAARFGSAKSQTGVSTAPSSCTSEEEGPATDPKIRDRPEADAGGEPCFSGRADSTKTKHAESDSKPVTPETARRREVIARAMAVAAAAAEAKAAAQVLAAKEARAAAARRATARIRGETSPERRDEKKEHAPFLSADASRSGALVLGTRVSPSEREKDENVATYTTRVERSSTRRSAKETTRHEENAADAADAADADPLADAARKLWGGLWGDARTKESISGGSSVVDRVGSHRSGASHRAATSRLNKGKGATAARRALDAAKKRAHAAQVASARLADASGITGWSCDEPSFLPYESPDGPFLPGTETRVYAPSFLDAPRPAPRDWSRVKARVVSRRNADEEE